MHHRSNTNRVMLKKECARSKDWQEEIILEVKVIVRGVMRCQHGCAGLMGLVRVCWYYAKDEVREAWISTTKDCVDEHSMIHARSFHG